MLSIICEPCGRRGRYNVERLRAEHGDAKLTNLLVTLADCDRARPVPNAPRLDPLRFGPGEARCGCGRGAQAAAERPKALREPV
jgi:hypothetical protein